MPTYEYRCTKCGHRLERRQSMNEKPLVRCPECRGRLERLISGGAGLLLSGRDDGFAAEAPSGCQAGSCDMSPDSCGGACGCGEWDGE